MRNFDCVDMRSENIGCFQRMRCSENMKDHGIPWSIRNPNSGVVGLAPKLSEGAGETDEQFP